MYSNLAGSAAVTASPTKRVIAPVSSSSSQQVEDSVSISAKAREMAGKSSEQNQAVSEPEQSSDMTSADKSLNLSEEELEQVQKLKMRDAEVRAHEQAHLSVAGSYAKGSASFTLQRGPDGNSYAVGGEVGIDLSDGKTPEETVEKMRTIRRAALAPASPSGADRRIASQASAKEAQARQELMEVDQEALLTGETSADNADDTSISSSSGSENSGESPQSTNSGVAITALKAGLAAYSQFSG